MGGTTGYYWVPLGTTGVLLGYYRGTTGVLLGYYWLPLGYHWGTDGYYGGVPLGTTGY